MGKRDDFEDYRGDVTYAVWRSGGNPDCVSYDRVQSSYYNGLSSDGAASRELRVQREAYERRQYEREQEDYGRYLAAEYDKQMQAEAEEYCREMEETQGLREALHTDLHLYLASKEIHPHE